MSRIKWNINWREIFGTRTGECNVRVKLISISDEFVWDTSIGSIRGTFASNTSNTSNGVVLAPLTPQYPHDQIVTSFSYMEADTLGTNGVTIVIPNTNMDFTVSLLGPTETFLTGMLDYQLWLYFDVFDENPLLVGDQSTAAVPPSFKFAR